ncbi:6274_t:CDS:2, partial [Cetraspora pellucida]
LLKGQMSEKHKLKSDNEDFHDWETLYKNVLNHYNIKFISESRQTVAEIFESDLLSNNLEIQNLKCCGIILIAARRFEVKRGCQISINYKEGKHFQLLIYAMEMPSELKIIKSKETDHLKFKIN